MSRLSAVQRLYLAGTGEPQLGRSVPPGGASVAWIDIDLNQVDQPLGEITGLLAELCPPGTADADDFDKAARDLADVDPWPDVETFGPIHKTSVTYVLPDDAVSANEEVRAGEGPLACRIELAVTESGILSVWHPAHRLTSTADAPTRNDIDLDEFRIEAVRLVNSSVEEGSLENASDLAIAFISATVASFSPHRRSLHQTLDDWERDYYEHHFNEDDQQQADDLDGSDAIEAASRNSTRSLAHVHTVGVLLSRELDYLTAPRERAARYWAGRNPTSDAGTELAKNLDEKVDRYRRSLRDTRDRVRASLDLSHSVESARRDAEARRRDEEAKERDEAARKMDYFIAKLAAVFLAPTLVAGFYGINTHYPDAGTDRGTIEAVVLMIVSAAGAWWAISRLEKPDRTKRSEHEG